MINIINDISMRKAAIVSGVAIMVMTVAAVVATNLTIGSLIVKDDAVITTNNIITSEVLFRSGIFSWLIILICDVLAAWGLYIFLKPVNKHLSLLMAWFRLVYAAILGTALLNYVNVLLLISGDDYVSSFGIEKFQSQVMLSLDAFNRLVPFSGTTVRMLSALRFNCSTLPASSQVPCDPLSKGTAVSLKV